METFQTQHFVLGGVRRGGMRCTSNCVSRVSKKRGGAIRGANWEAEEMSGQKLRHPGQLPRRCGFSQQKWKSRHMKTHLEVRIQN